MEEYIIFDNMNRLVVVIFIIFCFTSCIKKKPNVIIETDFGDITIELYFEKAPITAKNFIRYITEERYKEASFYRVVTPHNQPDSRVKIEVIQGGLFEDDHPRALPPIPHESTKLTGILHLDGVISMARYEPGTATFEFFICIGDQPSLDYGGSRNKDNKGFAAFGKVIDGMDVVKKINNQPEKDQYLIPRIFINNMRIQY